MRSLEERIRELPRAVPPGRDLWPAIEHRRRRRSRLARALAAALATVGVLVAVAVPVGVLGSRRPAFLFGTDQVMTRTARLARPDSGEVTIVNPYGSVIVQTAPGEEVRVRARLSERGLGLELSPSSDGSAVMMSVTGKPSTKEGRSHLEVTVPDGSSIRVQGATDLVQVSGSEKTRVVDVSNRDGEVRVTGAALAVSASSFGGAVVVEGSFPSVSARTATGDIAARGTVSKLETDTVDGLTRVEIRRLESGRLRSVSGDLEVAVDFRDPAPLNSLQVESGSGAIRLRVPEALQASYEIVPSSTAFARRGSSALVISPRVLSPERSVAIHASPARAVSLDKSPEAARDAARGRTVSFDTGSDRTRITLRSSSGDIAIDPWEEARP